MKFEITTDIYDKCLEFAQNSVGTSTDKYAKRNQFNKDKITQDIRNGKIAEECVYQLLSKKYEDLTTPDYKIYSAKDKSWDADLSTKDFKLAVKSQDYSSAVAYGESWVFQAGSGGKDCDTGIFGKSDHKHYVAFVSLNVPKRIGEIKAIVDVDWLHQNNLFKEMKLKVLRNNKVAVYYSDLEQFDKIFQL